MTISKAALTVGTLAFVGLFGGGIYLFSQAGTIVKGFLEKTGSEVLGVPVEIGSVIVNLKDKSAVVKNVVIGNPEGFDKPYLMAIGHIGARLDSVSKELVVIDMVDITDTNVNFELTEKGSNVMALKKGINPSSSATTTRQGAEGEVAEAEAKAAAMKVIINDLKIGEMGLYPSVSIANSLNYERNLTVTAIALADIGRKEGGVLAKDAIAQVFEAVMQDVNSSAAGAGLSPRALLESFGGDALDKAKDKVKGALGKFF